MIDDKSTAESLGSTRTYGQVRCMNPSCTSRITPQPGQTSAKCPKCGSEWRIFWVKAGFPRVVDQESLPIGRHSVRTQSHPRPPIKVRAEERSHVFDLEARSAWRTAPAA